MAFCNYSTEFIANDKTEVDNIFITNFLPFANDECIKVYLYGLYLCKSGSLIDNTLEHFARVLSMNEDEIISIFKYWEEMGLVQVLSTNPIEIKYIPLQNILTGKVLFKTDKFDEFNKQAQELFATHRQITKTEYGEYYDFLERYHMDQDALLMIMNYCIETKSANIGYSYILAVAKNWANEGILTRQDVEEKLNAFQESSSEVCNILKILGLKRNSFIEEKNLYKKWTQELGFEYNVILYIVNNLKNKSRVNFDKIDCKIMKYYNLGLFSIMEIEAYEQQKTKLYELAKKVNTSIGVYYENLEMVVDNYISKWINLGFSEEAILEISTYCRKTSIRTLEGLDDKIQKFYKLGILTIDALHSYLDEILKIDKEIQVIIDAIGLNRKVNSFDREFYKTWKSGWNHSNELINYATSLAIGKTQPMQYINSILANWHQNNISTIEEAKKNSTYQNASPKIENTKGRSYKKEDYDALIQSIDEIEI